MTDHELAQIAWDYLHVGHTPEKSDIILCLGSHDRSVAVRAVELYAENLAPKILFSGGFGRLTKGSFKKSEAESFANAAVAAGVPKKAILLEDKSSNTGENILFSAQLLREKNLQPRSIILVQKPYAERRALATFEAQWPQPQPKFTVTSAQVSFEAYCRIHPERMVINIMVGDVQRIREYPKLGFTTKQYIPDGVWRAFEELVARGYTEHLVQ